MSCKPSHHDREPVTRQLDLLAEEVKYLRELINSAHAEEWRLLRSFFGLNAAELHSEIAERHFRPGGS